MNITKIFKSKFSRDTIWLALAQIGTICSGVFINIFIGEALGIESLGLFHQSLAFYLILSTLLAFGLNNSIIKKVSEYNSKKSEVKLLLTASLCSTLIISLTLCVSIISIVTLFPFILSSSELSGMLPIHLLAIPLFNLNKNYAAFYSAKRMQNRFAAQRLFRWLGLALLLYIFTNLKFELPQMLYSFIIVEGFLFIYNTLRNLKNFDFSFQKSLINESISFGLGSYISEVASILNSSLDVIIVGYVLSYQDAGRYSFIIFFVKTMYIFPGIIMQNINPIISNHWAQNQIQELNIKLKKLSQINFLILSVQAIFLLLSYNFLMSFLSHTNNSSFGAFSISLIGCYIFGLIYWGGSVLVMTGKLKANFKRTALVLILNITTLSILSASFGFIGSVIAVSLNGITSFFLLKSFIYKETGLKVI